ncbi:MAG: hypothetical protein E6F94_06495 [Actinobacteria bacterium]|nr:MAG: hypothetical protein E6G38_01210 [Actinomycetota bacterium]TMM26330.1 MAG: hypothetical protein E6F94_06495 [Actinomycetota bacterium]
MEERERRIGRNEALFREVNERIERVSGALQTGTDSMTILCECGNESCVERIEVSVSDYERIRKDPKLFFVHSGHAKPEVETVVEEHEGYDVVRKNSGPAADMARELDPRSD